MKKLSSKKIILIVFSLFISAVIIDYSSSVYAVYNHESIETKSLTSTDTPIIIDFNHQFDEYSSTGLGTLSNPYIIENFNITTLESVGIQISDTSSFFVIRNCFVSTEGFGISIINVAHETASIINNTIKNTKDVSISIYSSQGTIVINNTIQDTDLGILLSNSPTSKLTHNIFDETDLDIFLSNSPSSIMISNTLYKRGLEFDEATSFDEFVSLTIEDNWVNEKQLGYFTNLSSIFLSEPVYSQLIIVNCSNISISNQELSSVHTSLMVRWSENITITNNTCSLSFTGFLVKNSEGIILSNNTCVNNVNGMNLRFSPEISLINNSFSSNQNGLIVNYCINSNIVNNYCNNNSAGISMSYSSGSSIINNSLTYDGFDISGSSIGSYIGYHFQNNRVNEKEFGFFINFSEFSIQNPFYGQIFLINCSNFEVSNQAITDTSKGLSAYWCNDFEVKDNTFIDNNDGLILEDSSNLLIYNNTCSNNNNGMKFVNVSNLEMDNNTCSNNYIGVSFISSSDSTINHNNCSENYVAIWFVDSYSLQLLNSFHNNNDHGIYIEETTTSTLENNTINYNHAGIRLWYSPGNFLINNSCTQNNFSILVEYSSNVEILRNTCYQNTDGIYLWGSDFCLIKDNLLQQNSVYGVHLAESSNNIIYHNTFIDNNLGGTSQGYDSGANNIWFDVIHNTGNFWSDLGSNCTYELDGSANSLDLYPSNVIKNCGSTPNETTFSTVSILTLVFFGCLLLISSFRTSKVFSSRKNEFA